jgi:hypothetical protein
MPGAQYTDDHDDALPELSGVWGMILTTPDLFDVHLLADAVAGTRVARHTQAIQEAVLVLLGTNPSAMTIRATFPCLHPA